MNLLEELRALDPRDPGRWPFAVRAGTVGVSLHRADAAGLLFLRLD